MNLTGTSGNDTLIGSTSADTLSGLAGNDYLNGQGGADLYRFNRGHGQDTLYDSSSDISTDVLAFTGTGLTSTNAIVTRVGTSDDLKISFGGGITDSVVLTDQLDSYYTNRGVESIQFSNGVTWSEAQLRNAYLTLGASTNDLLEGTALSDTIIGGLGTDYLYGYDGADTYRFNLGHGQDILNDSSNDTSIDVLAFTGAGLTSANAIITRVGTSDDLKISFGGGITDSVVLTDQLDSYYTNRGVESIQFSNGVTWSEAQLRNAYLTLGASTNDLLEGTALSDTIIGGLGTDYLYGYDGADTYRFNLGHGQDILNDSSNDTSIDVLAFTGAGLTSANAIVTRVGTSDDLKISFGGGITDSVVLTDQLDSYYTNRGVESIQFSNGVTWSEAQLRNAYLTLGAATNDVLTGTSGNDTIRGGLGTDYLNGQAGADTYQFNRGDGQDTLDDESNDTSVDRLILAGTGLTSTNVIVTRIGTSNDVKISFGGGIADSIVLENQIYGTYNYGVERIQFSDGVTWTETQLRNAIV
jgi:Ca2+-binding RTX toxin-like protein